MTPLCREARIHGLWRERENREERGVRERETETTLSPNETIGTAQVRGRRARSPPPSFTRSHATHRLGWKDRPLTRLDLVSNLVCK